MEQVHRRDALKLMAASFMLSLVACRPTEEPPLTLPSTIPGDDRFLATGYFAATTPSFRTIQEYIKKVVAGKNYHFEEAAQGGTRLSHPILRAASVTLRLTKGLSVLVNQAGIFMDESGEPEVVSLSSSLPFKQDNSISINIPGIGVVMPNRDDIEVDLLTGTSDGSLGSLKFKTGTRAANLLKESIAQGKITPLTTYRGSVSDNTRAAIIMPDHGVVQEVRAGGSFVDRISPAYPKDGNLLWFKLSDNYLCRNISGQPVLRVNQQGHILPESIGIASSLIQTQRDAENSECGTIGFIAVPHR